LRRVTRQSKYRLPDVEKAALRIVVTCLEHSVTGGPNVRVTSFKRKLKILLYSSSYHRLSAPANPHFRLTQDAA